MTTPNDHEAFFRLVVGLPLSHIWRGYGSAIFLEFGALHQRTRRDGSIGEPQGTMSLMIEWSWRIEDDRAILCGSDDDDACWSSAFQALLGSKVQAVEWTGRLPEIVVSLSNSMRVLSFMTAEGLPSWVLFDNSSTPRRWLHVEENGLLVSVNDEADPAAQRTSP